MKTLLTVALTLLLVGAVYLATTFSVVKTMRGDEFLILRAEQARECADGEGCAVFSEREFNAAVLQLLTRAQRNRGAL